MRVRLDRRLVEKGLFDSREKARRAVMAGSVTVDGVRVDKPGTAVSEDSRLDVIGPKEPFVSRAGRKNHHPAGLEVTHRLVAIVVLTHLIDAKCRHGPGIDPALAQRVLHRQ